MKRVSRNVILYDGRHVSEIWLHRHLCKFPVHPTACHKVRLPAKRMTKAEKLASLRVNLESGIARGIFYKTADGRYGLTEWLRDPSLPAKDRPAATSVSPNVRSPR